MILKSFEYAAKELVKNRILMKLQTFNISILKVVFIYYLNNTLK